MAYAPPPDGARMGLEIEYHQMFIVWRRREDNQFWPPAAGDVATWGNIPIPAGRSLFVPADLGVNPTAPFFPAPANVPAYGNDANVDWTNNWGLRGCPDAIGNAIISANNVLPVVRRGQCIVELNTSAQLIRNYDFWYWARIAANQFNETLKTLMSKPSPVVAQTPLVWRPIRDILDAYNERIRSWVKPANINEGRRFFGLKLSDTMLNLANGNPGVPMTGPTGVVIPDAEVVNMHWEAFATIGYPLVELHMCDVQVNYSIPLGWFAQNITQWTNLWNGHWTHKIAHDAPVLDPYVGDLPWSFVDHPVVGQPNTDFRLLQHNPKRDIYRTQLYNALWKRAEVEAVALINSRCGPAYGVLPLLDRNLIKGLVIYLLAAGSVSIVGIGNGTTKQCTPQLPKTGPAALAEVIRARSPATAAVMDTLASNGSAGAAQNIMINTLRNMALLQLAPGNLPAATPQPAYVPAMGPPLPTYPALPAPENMLAGHPPANFQTMWINALNPPAHGAPIRNYGFTTAAPFHCAWSNSVQTGVPPAVQASTDMLFTFESRYGACVLNIGFNPKVRVSLFTKSYLSLLEALEPGAAVAAKAVIGEAFGYEAVGDVGLLIPITLARNLVGGIH